MTKSLKNHSFSLGQRWLIKRIGLRQVQKTEIEFRPVFHDMGINIISLFPPSTPTSPYMLHSEVLSLHPVVVFVFAKDFWKDLENTEDIIRCSIWPEAFCSSSYFGTLISNDQRSQCGFGYLFVKVAFFKIFKTPTEMLKNTKTSIYFILNFS